MIALAHISRAGLPVLALLAGAVAAQDEALRPEISAAEVLTDRVNGEDWVRFRLVLPRLDPTRGDALAYEDIEPLFEALCRETALPYLRNHGLAPAKIVISLSDRTVTFGTTDPTATQYFDQFRLENGDCIWEGF